MTVKEIDELARKKADTDKTVTILETGLYYQLRSIYESYDKGDITADDAKAEKGLTIKTYDAYLAALTDYDRLLQQNRDIEQKLEQHRKIFKRDDAQRVKLSGLMCEANKNGCEICRKIARIYDGRNEV